MHILYKKKELQIVNILVNIAKERTNTMKSKVKSIKQKNPNDAQDIRFDSIRQPLGYCLLLTYSNDNFKNGCRGWIVQSKFLSAIKRSFTLTSHGRYKIVFPSGKNLTCDHKSERKRFVCIKSDNNGMEISNNEI